MKTLMAMILLATSTTFAATSGEALKKQVEKMGTCVGKNVLEGYELTFDKQKTDVAGVKAQMLSMVIASDAYGVDAYTTDDAYSYTMAEEDGLQPSIAFTPWRVSGSKVLVYVQGQWMSLTIGFKSKTCWF